MFMVAGFCALEVSSHLGIHFGRTVEVTSLLQQDTIFFDRCRGIDERCWRERAETQLCHVRGKGGGPLDECLIRSCIEQHAQQCVVLWHRVARAVFHILLAHWQLFGRVCGQQSLCDSGSTFPAQVTL